MTDMLRIPYAEVITLFYDILSRYLKDYASQCVKLAMHSDDVYSAEDNRLCTIYRDKLEFMEQVFHEVIADHRDIYLVKPSEEAWCIRNPAEIKTMQDIRIAIRSSIESTFGLLTGESRADFKPMYWIDAPYIQVHKFSATINERTGECIVKSEPLGESYCTFLTVTGTIKYMSCRECNEYPMEDYIDFAIGKTDAGPSVVKDYNEKAEIAKAESEARKAFRATQR